MKKIPFLPLCLSPCPAPSLRRSDESGSDKGGGSWVERDKIRNICWQLYFCNKCESNNTNTDRKGMSLFCILSNQIKHDPMLSVHLIRIKIKLKQNPASFVKPLLPTLGSCRPPASLAKFCRLCRLDAPHLCPLLSDLPTERVSSVTSVPAPLPHDHQWDGSKMSLQHATLVPVGWSLYFAFIFENVFMGQRHLEFIFFFQHFKDVISLCFGLQYFWWEGSSINVSFFLWLFYDFSLSHEFLTTWGRGAQVWFYLYLSLLGRNHLKCLGIVFNQIRKNFGQHFFKSFFCPIFSFLSC